MKEYELDDAGYWAFGEARDDDYTWCCFTAWLKVGVFYWAKDSGCSCNYPYEYDNFPDDFDGHGTAHDALKALSAWQPYESETLTQVETLRVNLMDYRP